MDIEDIISQVVHVGFQLHKEVGPGLLESVYETVLAKRLSDLGFRVERQKSISIEIDGIFFENAFKADLIVNDVLLIEIKSVERLSPLHIKQLLTYLRLKKLPLGLVINFGGDQYKDNVKRVTNNYV